MCDQWRHDPGNFILWAVNHGWQKDLQIDRVNNDSNYSPENVRFVTSRENGLNRRTIQSNNKSGYCGIGLNKEKTKWMSQIMIHYKTIYLGS